MDSDPELVEATSEEAMEAQFREKIKDLIPRYLADIRKDVVLLDGLLQAGSLERIRSIGHVLKGTGSNFGFPELTYWGAAIEESAVQADIAKLREQINAVVGFLARVDQSESSIL
jgi:HPt (histidine-containing phosphotransfer) domain-containing protein